MSIAKIVLAALAVALLWGASLAVVYGETRAKWYALGVSSGETGGRGMMLAELCALARDGAAPEPVIWSHSVKASIVELSGAQDSLTLYCR